MRERPFRVRGLGVHPAAWVLGLAVAAAAPVAGATLTVYDDQLQGGFADWSWATRNLAQTAVVHSGARAISFEPDAWQGIFFHRDAGFSPADYEAIELWVNGGSAGGQQVTIAVISGGTPAGSAALASFVAGGVIPAGQWVKARVPFGALGLAAGTFDGLWIQDATGGNQGTLFVDDVVLNGAGTPPGPVTVAVDPTQGRRPVSPLLFGVNFGDDTRTAQMGYTLRRWGGNSASRYSWTDDASNHASDWFFMSIPEDNASPGALPNGSSADRFIDASKAAGAEVNLTVPMIGWVPKDRTWRWSFSVAKYGPQQQTECTVQPSACHADAGNGNHPDGSPIIGNDPNDASRPVDPTFVTSWMDHIAARGGGVHYYALDNEPALWNSTHRDVHPQPLTYDEQWQRTVQYASAIKQKDPAAKVVALSAWGWCEYFYSAADGCQAGADRAAHGNLPLTQWILRQVKQYQQAHGLKLVDAIDIHYYPQAANVTLSDDESAGTSALRLRSLKSLYDATYVDESWIGQPVQLVPRLRQWIDAELPGTLLVLGEYNWGGDNGASSALAHAEALAIFAREGVDLATRWVAPATGTRVEDAFSLYRNYDGAGSKVTGDTVKATSSNVDAVGAYAVQAASGRLHVLLFNKDTADRTANVSIAGGPTGTAKLYRFTQASRLAAAGTAAATAGALSLTLPARSATLAVLDGGTPQPCVVDATTLCLAGGRFEVRVQWTNYNTGVTSAGQAAPLTSDTGYFWFFKSSNVELIVKVLDGRSVNGKFWVFYGALSDLEYDFTITDTQTGAKKTYHNAPRSLSSLADTNAF